MSGSIALAADHGGLELKNQMGEFLQENGYTIVDFGTNSPQSCDYPDFAAPACKAVTEGQCEFALLFCGTGVGMSIAANKIEGIRACCCSDCFSVEMTRRHNNANVLCLGGRVVGPGLAQKMIQIFLSTGFDGDYHQRRIDKITKFENEC